MLSLGPVLANISQALNMAFTLITSAEHLNQKETGHCSSGFRGIQSHNWIEKLAFFRGQFIWAIGVKNTHKLKTHVRTRHCWVLPDTNRLQLIHCYGFGERKWGSPQKWENLQLTRTHQTVHMIIWVGSSSTLNLLCYISVQPLTGAMCLNTAASWDKMNALTYDKLSRLLWPPLFILPSSFPPFFLFSLFFLPPLSLSHSVFSCLSLSLSAAALEASWFHQTCDSYS